MARERPAVFEDIGDVLGAFRAQERGFSLRNGRWTQGCFSVDPCSESSAGWGGRRTPWVQ
ncbi:hypothetical protein [Arthrobacter sp. MDT1-65]